jgi:hypothetical protein
MANIVITTKGTSGIYVDFGDYDGATVGNIKISSPVGFNAKNLEKIEPYGIGVRVVMSGLREGATWHVTHDSDYVGSDYFIIDSIDGLAPTGQTDLISKLTALM